MAYNPTQKCPQRTREHVFLFLYHTVPGECKRMNGWSLKQQRTNIIGCRVGTMSFFLCQNLGAVQVDWSRSILSSSSTDMGIHLKTVKPSPQPLRQNATLTNAFKFQMASHPFFSYSTKHSRISKPIFLNVSFQSPGMWKKFMVQVCLDLPTVLYPENTYSLTP